MTQWWQRAVIYQVYPQSFQDSNGDGIGDLKGLIQRLDYLQKLGIDAIWLSPVYQSPGQDNGYDISDYQAINPQFGTMADLEALIRQAKARDIRIIMDLVVNHTSDEHRWFKVSRQSRANPYRDYYIWRDGSATGGPPNAMKSTFSGSAWRRDEATGQYYLHLFGDKQPDLNWANPQVRQAIYKMMNFWISKGIGGFRMDVIDLIGKEPDRGIRENGPKLHPYLQEMNRATFGDTDLLTVGETWGATPSIAQQYADPKRHELSMVFQFEMMQLDQQNDDKWALRPLDPAALKQVLIKWQTAFDYTKGWNSLFWNNHDLPRIVSRWGNDQRYRVKSAKMFAILLHLLRGTPYVYQGEEIGMTNAPVASIVDVQDIESANMYREQMALGQSEKTILTAINAKGRDNARTPMQWRDAPNAGFTTSQPWLRVNPNYHTINVAAALDDPDSIFYTYQQLIRLRHENDVIVNGRFEAIQNLAPAVMAYYRVLGHTRWLVVVNLSEKRQPLDLNDQLEKTIVTNDAPLQSLTDQTLQPYQAFAAIVRHV
ncbi:glycoside hydrolase family 13 protein [Lacticaseibacillus paracasei]|uniref:glycoside hydrolase family 13 protein n=1 Tax=Lacticaseibacillus paracasei TaxID=1597 RepID=UPI000343C6D6|nr:alpha-glucosidase [Lacticaseibacillus paracasei]PTS58115.1 alpha-glucosidase [Lactobacillus sp. DS22_6]EPC16170.1 Glucan 1,6-alpha-glucosidase [Lacticaseibacillus paracasei subsp. paracasei Lpp230]MBS6630095.1 alpha-glucosidase [Lacticaseibacillus paracasei]MBX4164656.1 alpha-glucosidase [Lacticaseibacillus paracasei]MCT3361779.1 alpha-glucosidase [Lacticaseibacillus paracasei]